MPSGSFTIGDSTAYTYSVSSGGSGTYIKCVTSTSVASADNKDINNTNFPIDPSSGLRWVKLNTMSITKNSGTAGFKVWTGVTSNSVSSGGVLPVLSERSYYQASTGLTYGAIFTSSGSLSLYRSNFSGGEVSTNVSTTTLAGNLRATFTYHTLPYAPGTPSASVSGQRVSVSWTAPSDNGGSTVQGYRVWRSTNGGSYSYYSEVTGTSLSFTGSVGSTYSFKVAAITTMVQNLRIAESISDATGPQSSASNTVTVSATTGTVPNVVGDSEATAISEIENAGFIAQQGEDVTAGATVQNNGTVASQTPASETSLSLGSSVTYRLYSLTTVSVPDVIGDTESVASQTITDYSLIPSVSYSSDGATQENNGTVKSQSPAFETSVAINSTVSIVVYQFSLNLGERMTGSSSSTAVTIGKRFDGSNWVNLTLAKRFDGTNWVNLTN